MKNPRRACNQHGRPDYRDYSSISPTSTSSSKEEYSEDSDFKPCASHKKGASGHGEIKSKRIDHGDTAHFWTAEGEGQDNQDLPNLIPDLPPRDNLMDMPEENQNGDPTSLHEKNANSRHDSLPFNSSSSHISIIATRASETELDSLDGDVVENGDSQKSFICAHDGRGLKVLLDTDLLSSDGFDSNESSFAERGGTVVARRSSNPQGLSASISSNEAKVRSAATATYSMIESITSFFDEKDRHDFFRILFTETNLRELHREYRDHDSALRLNNVINSSLSDDILGDEQGNPISVAGIEQQDTHDCEHDVNHNTNVAENQIRPSQEASSEPQVVQGAGIRQSELDPNYSNSVPDNQYPPAQEASNEPQAVQEKRVTRSNCKYGIGTLIRKKIDGGHIEGEIVQNNYSTGSNTLYKIWYPNQDTTEFITKEQVQNWYKPLQAYSNRIYDKELPSAAFTSNIHPDDVEKERDEDDDNGMVPMLREETNHGTTFSEMKINSLGNNWFPILQELSAISFPHGHEHDLNPIVKGYMEDLSQTIENKLDLLATIIQKENGNDDCFDSNFGGTTIQGDRYMVSLDFEGDFGDCRCWSEFSELVKFGKEKTMKILNYARGKAEGFIGEKFSEGSLGTPQLIICKTEEDQELHLDIVGNGQKQFCMLLSTRSSSTIIAVPDKEENVSTFEDITELILEETQSPEYLWRQPSQGVFDKIKGIDTQETDSGVQMRSGFGDVFKIRRFEHGIFGGKLRQVVNCPAGTCVSAEGGVIHAGAGSNPGSIRICLFWTWSENNESDYGGDEQETRLSMAIIIAKDCWGTLGKEEKLEMLQYIYFCYINSEALYRKSAAATFSHQPSVEKFLKALNGSTKKEKVLKRLKQHIDTIFNDKNETRIIPESFV